MPNTFGQNWNEKCSNFVAENDRRKQTDSLTNVTLSEVMIHGNPFTVKVNLHHINSMRRRINAMQLDLNQSYIDVIEHNN